MQWRNFFPAYTEVAFSRPFLRNIYFKMGILCGIYLNNKQKLK